jgi:uncharacterized protein
MRKRKPARSSAKKKPARKKKATRRRPARAKKKASRRSTSRRSTSRAPSRKAAPRRRASRPAPSPPKTRPGMITHTELASTDPPATRAWCERVLGWGFGESVPTPTGPYHMWRFENATGGGIRLNNPPEPPGSIPYCEVESIRDTFARALEAGAMEMVPPMALPSGMGWIAVVAAPGGVPIGFWAMR